MINQIYSTSEYITTAVSGVASLPWINMSTPSAGMVRYNGNTTSMEVYDGNSWYSVGNSSAMIAASEKMKEIMSWAESKMHMERGITQMLDNPTVADAYKSVKEAEEKLLVVMTLVQEEKKNG